MFTQKPEHVSQNVLRVWSFPAHREACIEGHGIACNSSSEDRKSGTYINSHVEHLIDGCSVL